MPLLRCSPGHGRHLLTRGWRPAQWGTNALSETVPPAAPAELEETCSACQTTLWLQSSASGTLGRSPPSLSVAGGSRGGLSPRAPAGRSRLLSSSVGEEPVPHGACQAPRSADLLLPSLWQVRGAVRGTLAALDQRVGDEEARAGGGAPALCLHAAEILAVAQRH